MKIDLYPCFNHLKQFNTIWLYSDPHFNDKDVDSFRGSYIDDEKQIKSINSKVGKKDVIIILGDIGDIGFVRRIKGYKILVMGNHDIGKSNYKRKVIDEVDNHLFDEVYSGVITLNDKIVLSHEPISVQYMFNIHGHDHSHNSFNDELHLNVCAEHINYTPISLNELINKGTFKNVKNIHRATIDKAIYKKKQEEWSKDEPNWDTVFSRIDNIPPKIYESGYECTCFGIIAYKGNKYPVYIDDYGCQDFIVYRYYDKENNYCEREISVRNMSGFLDWWFELNRMKDEYPNEIVYSEKR